MKTSNTIINATVVADSLSPTGDRLTSLLITFPRIILAEVNTHRMLSKNTSSSRAIPFEKMVEAIQEDPFIPIAWQKHHSGMQGTEYITEQSIVDFKKGVWLNARNKAVQSAEELYGNVSRARSMSDVQELSDTGVTKQLANRLLEPFMWTTMLITGSKEGWDNFFKLRCPQYTFDNVHFYKSKKEAIDIITDGKGFLNKEYELSDLDWLKVNKGQAEIHMMALAEAIYDAMNESSPKQLEDGEWHIPFGDKMQDRDIMQYIKGKFNSRTKVEEAIQKFKLKVSTARCARLSYMTFDGEIDYEKDLKLYDTLLESHHASPFEHVSRCLTEEEYNALGKMILDPVKGYIFEKGWVDNFKGFVSYRRILNF